MAWLKMDPLYSSLFWHLLGWAGRTGYPRLPGPGYLVSLQWQSCGLLGLYLLEAAIWRIGKQVLTSVMLL